MPKRHHLLTSGYHPLAFLLPFSLTKTKLNTKKEREKVIFSFQLAYFMHLWLGFSVSLTDMKLPPPTVVPSHTKKKKKNKPNKKPPKMKLQNQGNSSYFLQFQKEDSVDGLTSICTWRKRAGIIPTTQITPAGRQGRDEMPFPHQSSHSVDWKLSPISSSPRDKHARRHAKGVLDMFLDLKKKTPNHPKQNKKTPTKSKSQQCFKEPSLQPHLTGTAERCYRPQLFKGKKVHEIQKSQINDGANRIAPDLEFLAFL